MTKCEICHQEEDYELIKKHIESRCDCEIHKEIRKWQKSYAELYKHKEELRKELAKIKSKD